MKAPLYDPNGPVSSNSACYRAKVVSLDKKQTSIHLRHKKISLARPSPRDDKSLDHLLTLESTPDSQASQSKTV